MSALGRQTDLVSLQRIQQREHVHLEWHRIQLGDTPDTSKALRSLVAAGLVVRHGRGGRQDAFKYQVLKMLLAEPCAGDDYDMVKSGAKPTPDVPKLRTCTAWHDCLRRFRPLCGLACASTPPLRVARSRPRPRLLTPTATPPQRRRLPLTRRPRLRRSRRCDAIAELAAGSLSEAYETALYFNRPGSGSTQVAIPGTGNCPLDLSCTGAHVCQAFIGRARRMLYPEAAAAFFSTTAVFCVQVHCVDAAKPKTKPSSVGSHGSGPFTGSGLHGGGSSQDNAMAGSQSSAILCDAGNIMYNATSINILPSKAARTTGARHLCHTKRSPALYPACSTQPLRRWAWHNVQQCVVLVRLLLGMVTSGHVVTRGQGSNKQPS